MAKHIKKETEMVVESNHETKKQATSYETVLACYFKSMGHIIENDFMGNRASDKYKKRIKGMNSGRVFSEETKLKMSNSKKQLLKNSPDLLAGLSLCNEIRKKKVLRSDGHVYESTTSCSKDLKISGTKFKQLIGTGNLYKGFSISFAGVV